jgi:hypothetical protein
MHPSLALYRTLRRRIRSLPPGAQGYYVEWMRQNFIAVSIGATTTRIARTHTQDTSTTRLHAPTLRSRLPHTQHAAEDDDERAAAMRARALTDADWVVKKFEGQTDADVVRLNGGSTPRTRSRSERGGQGDDPLARFPSTSHW